MPGDIYFGISADGWHAKAILSALESVQAETERRALERAIHRCEECRDRDIKHRRKAQDGSYWSWAIDAHEEDAAAIRSLIDKPAAPDPTLDRTSALNADSILKYTVNRIVERDIDKEALTRVRAVLRRFAGLPSLPEEPLSNPTCITAIFGDGETKIVRTGPDSAPVTIENAGRIILELQDRVSELETPNGLEIPKFLRRKESTPDPLLVALAWLFETLWTHSAGRSVLEQMREAGLACKKEDGSHALTELGCAALALVENGR